MESYSIFTKMYHFLFLRNYAVNYILDDPCKFWTSGFFPQFSKRLISMKCASVRQVFVNKI